LLHKDVGDELAALADHLRFNPAWSTFFSTKPNCSTIPSCAASAWSPSAIPPSA
jgi:hypothetical protein